MSRDNRRLTPTEERNYTEGMTDDEIPGWLPHKRKHLLRNGQYECWYTTRVYQVDYAGEKDDRACHCGRPITRSNTIHWRKLLQRKHAARARTRAARRRGLLKHHQRHRRDRTGREYPKARAYYDARPMTALRALRRLLLRQGRPLPRALVDSFQARRDKGTTTIPSWKEDYYLERDL